MSPKQPQPLSHSFDTQASPDTTLPASTPKKGVKGPLILMFTPGILIILIIAIYAIANLAFTTGAPATTPSPDSGNPEMLFENENAPYRTSLNIILFNLGNILALISLPCFIGGLVWLIRRKTAK